MMENTDSLEKNLNIKTKITQSISSLLEEFENKISPALKDEFKNTELNDTLNKYSAALFIDYITKHAYSESKSVQKTKSVNTYSNLFIVKAKKYITEFNDSINQSNQKEIIKYLEENYIDKSQIKISYKLSHLRNEYTRGVISAIYSALNSNQYLESIGKAIKEGSRAGTSGDNQPKYREYWGIEKQIKKLIAE